MNVHRFTRGLAVTASLLSLLAASGCAGAKNTASAPRPAAAHIVLDETTVTSDPGIQLYVRHKYSSRTTSFTKNNIILFLEPFSVPTAMAFDVPGYSWMDDYANEGFDTWAMDFRGFGRSTRPAAMNEPATANGPVIRHQDGVRDLAAVVDYIKNTRHVDSIDILGWSWGAVVAGEYAGLYPADVNRLVLDGFMHGFTLPVMSQPYASPKNPNELNPKLPAYQVVNWEKAMMHWHMELSGHGWATAAAMAAVGKVYTASDPTAATRADLGVRRPMGPLVDLYYIWTNRPLYSLAKITCPTLVVRGAADYMAEKGVLSQLTGTQVKKEVVIPDATHWVLYEQNRGILLDSVRSFLDGQ